MGLRGPKPKGKVHIEWSPEFAYAIGLIVTDGCLYNDKRHISFVSKDMQQIKNFMKCLKIKVKIGKTISEKGWAYRLQFGDVNFYNFLLSIGLTPTKSKTIGGINIPHEYFFDFLRGCFDGDGSFYSYWDNRWRSSYMFYTEFTSASKKHIAWLRNNIYRRLHIWGHVTSNKENSIFNLKFGKKESLEIINKMYYSPDAVCLSRKKNKVKKALQIEEKQQLQYK